MSGSANYLSAARRPGQWRAIGRIWRYHGRITSDVADGEKIKLKYFSGEKIALIDRIRSDRSLVI
jgi:hypothetical protein